MTQTDDVIIIGGGHNGLVCACYLAAAGKSVRILERRSIVGGAAVTEEFSPGFRNSTLSYTVGLLDPQVIRDLRLYENGLKIVPRPLANFYPLPDSQSLTIHNDPNQTAKEYLKFSKKDAKAFPTFMEILRDIASVVQPLMHRSPPVMGVNVQDWMSMLHTYKKVNSLSRSRRRDFVDVFFMPVEDLLNRWFENEHVKATIAFDAIVGNYSSLQAAGSAYGLLHHALGELAGQQGVWGHAIGGMGAITQSMEKQAVALGVKIETSTEVVRVNIKHDRVIGVSLLDGTNRTTSSVVANVALKHLYKDLISVNDLDDEFRLRVTNLKTESGVFRMNVALSELPQFNCAPQTTMQNFHQSGIVIAPTLSYMDRAYHDAKQGLWSRQPVIELMIPSTVDCSLAPPKQHVASLFCQYFPFDRDWDKERERAADHVVDVVSQYSPNFRSSIIARQILTPLDLEREYRLPRGDIFHAAHNLNQLWLNRPLLGYSSYRGPLKGLYHCGAGAHPGGGVTGIPGKNAAQTILNDR